MENNSNKSIWQFSKATISVIGAGIASYSLVSDFVLKSVGGWSQLLAIIAGIVGIVIGYYSYKLSESGKD